MHACIYMYLYSLSYNCNDYQWRRVWFTFLLGCLSPNELPVYLYIYMILIFNTRGTHSTDEIQVWYTKQLILFHWSTAQLMKSQKTHWHRPPNFTVSDTFIVSDTFTDIKNFIRVIHYRLKSLICMNTYNCAVHLYILSQ